MRYAVIVVGALLVATPWHTLRAATLITLDSNLSAIVFTQAELPIISSNTFECDRHIYKADQHYSTLANGVYHDSKHMFGIYNHCYLKPVGKPLTLTTGKHIMRFLSANAPYTEVVFELSGPQLKPVPEGTYSITSGGVIQLDAQHRNLRAIRP